MKRPTRAVAWTIGAVAAAAMIAAGTVAWLAVRDDTPWQPATASPATPELVARGAYLVRAGSCEGCHTERGGARYAGGRAIETPFGVVRSSNLTPDASGLGSWSSDDFWRALHNGRSRDGRLLYPVFPYPNYTGMTRADAEAMYAYLQSLAPVVAPRKVNDLGFPFDQPAALAVWRALFFRPASHETTPARTPEWNRGAYLVETLGHCNACHSQRNAFGATAGPLDLAGGLIPVQNWYAPALDDPHEAGVADWPLADIVALLRDGTTARASVQGPMAEVVAGSTQHLSDADLTAMATYLQSLPPRSSRPPPTTLTTATAAPPAASQADDAGRHLYERNCAGCHGERGEGVAGAYPALAGQRAALMTPAANLVHIVLRGGFPPTTAGNPRPYGMPPFATVLSDAEVASVLTYVRGAWGNRAPAVSTLEVARFRGAGR